MSERFGWMCAVVLFVIAMGCSNRVLSQTDTVPFPPQELQPVEPSEEEHPLPLEALPKAQKGYVDWVAAVKEGFIKPLASLDPNYNPMPPVDFKIRFRVKNKDVPDVVFPHQPHILWLGCRNCHPSIFLMRAGVNRVTMAEILRGESCGRCHGVVAFPISDCLRCHSKPK